MQASFDDSGNGDSSITCVAGYFFRDSALAPFREQWKNLLGGRRFHMVDLVHGKEDFADYLDKTQREDFVRSLVATIKQHMHLGCVISVERAAYDKYIDELGDDRRLIGSPYALCAMLCLAASARWMEHNAHIPEETTYCFESGNSKQAEANTFLDTIVHNSAMEQRYQYVSHAFIKKNKLPSLDAADLLGWEWTQQCKRISGEEARPPRASLKSLAERPHLAEHFGMNDIRIAFVKRLLEPYVVPGAGATFPRPDSPA